MDTPIETISLDGEVVIRIYPDDNPENPRIHFDNFGTMVCWHRRYALGDPHRVDDHRFNPIHASPADMWAAILDGIELPLASLLPAMSLLLGNPYHRAEYYEWTRGQSRTERRAGLRRFLIDQIISGTVPKAVMTELEHELVNAGLVILPVYLYDHSGLAINTTGFSCPWDSGQVGYIYALPQTILDNWGVAHVDDPVRDPQNDTLQSARQRARDLLIAEVETYNQFLGGEVYGFVIQTPDDDCAESCWGFYGLECCKQEALASAKSWVDRYADPARCMGSGI